MPGVRAYLISPGLDTQPVAGLEELTNFLKEEARPTDVARLEFDPEVPGNIELEYGEDKGMYERMYYSGFLFTDGTKELAREDEGGTWKTKVYTIKNATWAVVVDATTHEYWSGDGWKEFGIVVYGSREVFKKVRNVLEEAGVYYTIESE